MSVSDNRFLENFKHDVEYICDHLYLDHQYGISKYIEITKFSRDEMRRFVKNFINADRDRDGNLSKDEYKLFDLNDDHTYDHLAGGKNYVTFSDLMIYIASGNNDLSEISWLKQITDRYCKIQ